VGTKQVPTLLGQEVSVMAAKLPNVHPGEVLLEEFLEPLGISQNKLARDIKVPPRRINEIVHGKRSVTADTALRLARYFGVSESFWMGLQTDYDLEETRRKMGKSLVRDVKVLNKAA
jgi:addiction module HigA family antidote